MTEEGNDESQGEAKNNDDFMTVLGPRYRNTVGNSSLHTLQQLPGSLTHARFRSDAMSVTTGVVC